MAEIENIDETMTPSPSAGEGMSVSEAAQSGMPRRHRDPQGNEAQWYVLRAISGKEAKVKEVLDAAIRNTDLGRYVFKVLIPTEKVVSVKNGKKVVKEKNLFSGYVFVEASLTGEVEYELRNTTNVIDFLKGRGKDAKPEPLRESEVFRMLGEADAINEDPSDEINDYMVGETVKVTEGPFKDFNGEIEEVYADKKKLKVMVKIFGRKTPLELDNSQVERV